MGQARRIAPSQVRRIIWTEPTRGDLEHIRAYIGQFRPRAAERMAERLLEAADDLSEYAERGRPIGNGRREFAIVWPYLIRYRIDGDAVYILRVRHGAQAREAD